MFSTPMPDKLLSFWSSSNVSVGVTTIWILSIGKIFITKLHKFDLVIKSMTSSGNELLVSAKRSNNCIWFAIAHKAAGDERVTTELSAAKITPAPRTPCEAVV